MSDKNYKFAAMSWAAAVKHQSNLSFYQIEVKYMPKDCIKIIDGIKKTPELMKRYANGEITPIRNGKKCGGRDFVRRIEEDNPGTERWLDHPAWNLIKVESLTMHKIHLEMARCNIDCFGDFFSKTSSGEFSRGLLCDLNQVKKVASSKHKIDVLAFLLGLLREAELKIDPRQHRICVSAMLSIFPELSNLPQLVNFSGKLFDILEERFFRVAYPFHEGGSEVVFPSSWRDKWPAISVKYPIMESEANSISYRNLITSI